MVQVREVKRMRGRGRAERGKVKPLTQDKQVADLLLTMEEPPALVRSSGILVCLPLPSAPWGSVRLRPGRRVVGVVTEPQLGSA